MKGSVLLIGNALVRPASEVWQYRHLLGSLTARELRVRYKQSWLGIGWAVCVPLSMMLIFTFVFTRAVNVVGGMGIEMPYALFAYTGLVPWMFFASGLNACVNSLTGNRNLVTKVYFPREVFPLSCIGSALVDFLIASTVLIALVAYFHISTDWTFTLHASVLFVPVVVLVQVVFMVGVGMVLAMANLFYRDVRQVFTLLIQLWMFATNVVYPLPNDGSWTSRLVSANPMAPVIAAYRDCIIRGHLPSAAPFVYATAVAVIVFVVGWTLFHRAEFRFAESI